MGSNSAISLEGTLTKLTFPMNLGLIPRTRPTSHTLTRIPLSPSYSTLFHPPSSSTQQTFSSLPTRLYISAVVHFSPLPLILLHPFHSRSYTHYSVYLS